MDEAYKVHVKIHSVGSEYAVSEIISSLYTVIRH